VPIVLKSPADLEKMRAAGQVVAAVHKRIHELVVPGVTTAELNRVAHEMIVAAGGWPSFLHYVPRRDPSAPPYPYSICASVNDELVHGFSTERELNEGDIISVDVGVYLDGFHGDRAVTLPVGRVSDEARALIEAAEGAFWAGVRQMRDGVRLGDAAAAIQEYAESRGYSVVRTYSGHGVGRKMHEDPDVPNFGTPGSGTLLRTGMTLAVEPMLTTGAPETRELDDHWTVVMADGSLAAHYEHTVAVLPDGVRILTDTEECVVEYLVVAHA
jgi:methionyl aminopeptidase